MGCTLVNILTRDALACSAHDSNPTLVQYAEAREVVEPVEIHQVQLPHLVEWCINNRMFSQPGVPQFHSAMSQEEARDCSAGQANKCEYCDEGNILHSLRFKSEGSSSGQRAICSGSARVRESLGILPVSGKCCAIAVGQIGFQC